MLSLCCCCSCCSLSSSSLQRCWLMRYLAHCARLSLKQYDGVRCREHTVAPHVVGVVAALQSVTRTVGDDGCHRRGAGCRSSSSGLSLFGHGSKAPLPKRVLVAGEVERTVELEAENYARSTWATEQNHHVLSSRRAGCET